MDPLFALLIAMYIAGKFTSNVAQDVAWKARGEDPPSLRRERERWERKQAKRAEGDGPGRKLLVNAWADACAAGDERRARMVERAAERRHRKWETADQDAVEAEARDINDRVDAPPVEAVYTCGGCQRTIGQSDVAGYALSGDPLCRACRTDQPASADSTPGTGTGTATAAADAPAAPSTAHDTAKQPALAHCVLFERRCHVNDVLITCPECGADTGLQLAANDGDASAAARCPHGHEWTETRISGAGVADLHRATQGRPTSGNTVAFSDDPRDFPPPTTSEDPDESGSASTSEGGGTVTDLNAWRSKGATPPITKEDIVSGETTNLAAALDYTQGMADQCGAGAASTETSIATLQNADVSGPAIGHLARAQELLSQAMAEFSAANADLSTQIAVKDAYQAAPGAGNKDFQLQD